MGEVLEYMIAYGWALIVIAIVVGVLVFIVVTPAADASDDDVAAFNFCKAWAEDSNFIHFDGSYNSYLISGWQVGCAYSTDGIVFDGGVSPGKKLYKYFNISKIDLLKWADANQHIGGKA